MGRDATKRDADERRDVAPRPVEDREPGMVPEGEEPQAGDGWLESGAEDPAFFIKPSD